MASVKKLFKECSARSAAMAIACPGSLLTYLLYAQILHDCPIPNAQVNEFLDPLRGLADAAVKKPLNAADLGYAKAIATFDEEVFTLALIPDVRECVDSAAYRREALASAQRYTLPVEYAGFWVGSVVFQFCHQWQKYPTESV